MGNGASRAAQRTTAPRLLAAVAAAVLALAMPTAASAHVARPSVVAHHKCTRTSTHKCIRGGEFCPAKDYGKSGWSATGKRYVCKGSHTHPHWELP